MTPPPTALRALLDTATAARGARGGNDDGRLPPPPLDEEGQAALAYVLRSTQQRPQTEAELRAKLRGREVPDEAAEAVLRRAKQLRAIDDAAFARAWVEDRGAKRGYGVGRLRDELRRRQVPEVLIEDALAALEARDDLAVATELARERHARYPASLQPEAAARRLVPFLVRRGYPPGLAQRVAISVSGLDRSWD